MAKLILSLDQTLLNEYPLDQERLTIGRRPTNDVQIDNLAVSGEHAAILKLGNDFYIEDLESTNGTLVNSTPIKKHLLQHEDVVEFGRHQLKYINEAATSNPSMQEDFEKTMILRPSAMRNMEQNPQEASGIPKAFTPPPAASKPAQAASSPSLSQTAAATDKAVPKQGDVQGAGDSVGKIQVLNGSSTGRELVLNKALTTLGKPGVQVAVITKRPNGYFITHVEGQVFPIVNGASTGAQASALNDHDVIELAGVKMEFYLSKV